MGIFLGLGAAVGWGTADFLARYSARSIGTYRTMFFIQFIGFAVISVYLVVSGELVELLASAPWQTWLWAITAGLLNIVASMALYHAYKVGVLAIVSPVAASYAAVTVVLAVLSGETLTGLQTIGIILTLGGIALAVTHLTPNRANTSWLVLRRESLTGGVGLALLSAVTFGIAFWLLGFNITPVLGGVVPVWVSRLTTIVVLFLLALPVRQSLQLPTERRIWWLILGIGTFDTLAFLAYTFGLTTAQIAIVSVLSSLFGAVTVMLAWLILHERLQSTQWLGVALILVGVGLVST